MGVGSRMGVLACEIVEGWRARFARRKVKKAVVVLVRLSWRACGGWCWGVVRPTWKTVEQRVGDQEPAG